jgi:NADP-dependent aldehyde dehydrogenase
MGLSETGGVLRDILSGPGFSWLNEDSKRRASMLDGVAAALDSSRAEVLKVANEETALTAGELAPEFARMVGTLRMFANVVREGSWVRAAIDTPAPDGAGSIGPNHDVRRMLMPLGVVAVFGASNFPLAYGVCGGDTASALAAGCPVVVKEHPAHPRTGRLIHQVALQGLCATAGDSWRDWATSILGYVPNADPRDFSVAGAILSEEHIQAVGFTGSKKAGMAIEKLARERARPIPVFAEMGSCNPVYVSARAAERRGSAIADELADSILARHGQQCTKPGLIFVENLKRAGATLQPRLVERFLAAECRDMLAPWIRDAYLSRLQACAGAAGVSTLARGRTGEGDRSAPAALLGSHYKDWMRHYMDDTVQDEIFGPATVLVDVPTGQLGSYQSIEPHLVCSWYVEAEEVTSVRATDLVSRTATGPAAGGRTVWNGVPTGVRVANGMVHGGSFPATNRSDSTAVGPFAMERWCQAVCLQNNPDRLLRPELQDSNPLGIMRIVNGEYTRDPVKP